MSQEARPAGDAAPPPAVRVSIATSAADRKDFEFARPFRIGRGEDCEVCFKNEFISRAHAEVVFEKGQWWVHDLNSANGIFAEGQRVERVPVGASTILRLGVEGPFLALKAEPVPSSTAAMAAAAAVSPTPAAPAPASPPATGSKPATGDSLALYMDRYFGNLPEGAEVGERTMLIRQAYQQVHTKQKRKYTWVIAALGAAILVAGGYAFYLHRQASKQRALAQEMFYSMKSLDLDIANVEKLLTGSNNPQAADEIRKYQDRRKQMERSYDQFLSTLHVYDSKMTEQQRLILRIARIFGECEVAMPPEFSTEIQNYIKKWQSSGRLARAVRLANENGYTPKIAADFLAQDLPPEFFYLALQESDFDQYISGPMTRKGIAKGMWEFIPETAVKYGLQVGPLIDLRRPDPGDDRHHWDRATKAATLYIKDLYSTDAQASGMLVMACYNWGENYVLPLVRSMPPNPKERNFWKLLTAYRSKIPQETYDYVFYITSAAVIGENPRLFGFDFDNPLAAAAK